MRVLEFTLQTVSEAFQVLQPFFQCSEWRHITIWPHLNLYDYLTYIWMG